MKLHLKTCQILHNSLFWSIICLFTFNVCTQVISFSEMIALFFGVLLFPAFLLAADVKDYKNIYIKSFRCNASEKFVYKNYSCFAKSWSRKVSTGNMYGVAKIPLYNIKVSWVPLCFKSLKILWQEYAVLYFKYGVIYRQVMRGPTNNICEFTKWLYTMKDTPGRISEAFIHFLDVSAPGLIHKCPYLVRNL